MTNIWEFHLQSVSVSLVAGFVIVIKYFFKDKLSPRWQYGVWIVLALRILLPVKANKFVLLPFGIYLETLKTIVEAKLNSAFTALYAATEPSHVFPFISGAPQSITDILFVVYIIGFVAFLCFYLLSYIKLRFALRKGEAVTGEEEIRIKAVFERNNIHFIKVICVDGVDSAFICGVLRPVLVLPASRETHDNIILHEIMHLKYLDSLQSIFWCILRCLHWCSPFMHYVFNVIGNDMESLCDQRVLEKLEGEERRQYGVLLLNEVNRKYARMPCTTSVSNGGKNISRRIESIVRFKKYPQGMTLVSVCIIIMLAVPCLFVSAGGFNGEDIFYPKNKFELEKALACSRTYRCTTVAGAIDTYAKGMMNKNGIMLLTASPIEKHQEIIEEMRGSYYFDSGFDSVKPDKTAPFNVFNIIKTEKDRYSAVLVFSTPEAVDAAEKDCDEYNEYADSLFIPIEIFKENDFWVVVEAEDRTASEKYLNESLYMQAYHLGEDLQPLFYNTKKGDNGSLITKLTTTYNIDYKTISSENDFFFTDGFGYDAGIHRDAEFSSCLAETSFVYIYDGENYKSVKYVGVRYNTQKMDYEFSEKISTQNIYATSASDGSGSSNYPVNENEVWDKKIEGTYFDSNLDPKEVMEHYGREYRYAVYVDGNLTDDFFLEVKVNE